MRLPRHWIWLWLFALVGLLWAQGQGRSHAISMAVQLQPGEVVVCTQGGMVRMRIDADGKPVQTSSNAYPSDHCSVCSLSGAVPLPLSAASVSKPILSASQVLIAAVQTDAPPSRPLLAHAPPHGPPHSIS
ncbi:MAG: DUF2946 domain-containing protein [Burkholderiaceae bacterium]|jgi:hypothetical protein